MGAKAVEVRSRAIRISDSVTRPANTTAYAAGEVVGDSTANFEFANIADDNGGGGVIKDVLLVDSANQATLGQFELWLFTASPAVVADNAALALTDAEIETCIRVIPLSTSFVGNAGSGAAGGVLFQAEGVDIPFRCASTASSIYGVLVVRNAYTPVSGEIFTVILNVLADPKWAG